MADIAETRSPTLRTPGAGWVLAYGIAMLLCGVLALVWPFASALALGYFLGWSLSIAGGFAIVAGFRAHRVRGHRLDVFIGALALVIGLVFLLDPLLGDFSLLFLLAFRFAVAGVLEIGHGLRFRVDRVPLILLGAVDLLLAALLTAGVVAGDFKLAAQLVGLGYLVGGLAAVSAAVRSRLNMVTAPSS